MATAIPVPRLNANDDTVQVVRLLVAAGAPVRAGQAVAEVQTDKAVVEVEAPLAGIVLRLDVAAGDMVAVGRPLLWLGREGDVPPAEAAANLAPSGGISAKARLRMAELGLSPDAVAGEAGRVTVGRVEALAARRVPPAPAIDGERRALSPSQRAMVRMVGWQAVAAPAYVEVPFDQTAWQARGRRFSGDHRLPFDATLGLLAHGLVGALEGYPLANATLVDGEIHAYGSVNLGFAVKTPSGLAMVVVRKAETLDALGLVRRLFDLQRAAFANRLTPDESGGMTVAFSSLGLAVRHIPVLPPHTALIVAHAAHGATLGATYDHRLLDGAAVGRLLARLERPDDAA
ncbi:MAG: hypothetical protein EPN20_06970 [Magnetospirillum sp.]|nr:MAG: hypothetical protein EPN20_06970 [Magnetospirillum sp.]